MVSPSSTVSPMRWSGSENAVARRAQHALARKAADEAGNVRVRQRAAGVDDAPERVAAHRLDDRVAVLPRREAGADAHDDRRVVDLRAEIALGENRVHERVGRAAPRGRRTQGRLKRAAHPRAAASSPPRHSPRARRAGPRPSFPRERWPRKTPTVRRMAVGLGEIGHHHVDPAAPKAHGRAARDVSRAANQCKHTYTP